MVNQVVVCGDSFGCGIGLGRGYSFDKSFGGLVANHYNLPQVVYARPGCCNYVIYLQVQKIIDEFRHKRVNPFVLITTTNHSRFTFPSDYSTKEYTNYTIEDVDYISHIPYAPYSEERATPPFVTSREPKLVSDTVSNVLHFIANGADNLNNLYKHIKKKIHPIKQYYEHLYDDSIKETYDYSLILMMHKCLEEENIPHIILNHSDYNTRFINEKNFFLNNWGEFCSKYPDVHRSGHCDEQGHVEVSQRLIEKIQKNGMI